MIALFVIEMHNYPPFVLQLNTKNTLIPLDTVINVTKGTKLQAKLLLIYTKVTHQTFYLVLLLLRSLTLSRKQVY